MKTRDKLSANRYYVINVPLAANYSLAKFCQ